MKQSFRLPSIDIIVEQSNDKELKDHVINFGKHKGKKTIEIFKSDFNYIDWLEKQSTKNKNTLEVKEVISKLRWLRFEYFVEHYDLENITYNPNYSIPFGKYKDRKLSDIMKTDTDYVTWLKNQIPSAQKMFETWLIMKIQICLHEKQPPEIEVTNKTNNKVIDKSKTTNKTTNKTTIKPNTQITVLEDKDKDENFPSAPAMIVSESISKTYNLYCEGKTIDEIALLRKFKIQSIEDHIAKCIEVGLISEVPMLDIETKNYIIDIINEKCNGQIDKIKPIKELCDDGEIEVTYSQIKYAIAFMKRS